MFQSKNNQNRSFIRLLFFVFTYLSLTSFAQSNLNLINNYSAEQYTMCPGNAGQVDKATFWYLPTGGNGSTDYFNACANSNTLAVPNGTRITVPQNPLGYQYPSTGNGYFGFALYGLKLSGVEYREYLGNGLKQTLKNGKTYCLSYYVSLAEISRYSCANIGVVFSKDSVLYITSYPPQPLVLTPSFENTMPIVDTLNWVKVEGTYLSNGTERFITMGNFRTDANTTNTIVKPLDPNPGAFNFAYYYIDDISVVEINNADSYIKDSIIKCVADSVNLGTDSTEFATYTWSSTVAGLAALSCTNCPNPIAKPLVTTKYYLTKQQCSATTIDSVTVVVLTPTTQANAGNSNIICEGDVVQLGVADSASFVSYSWQGSGGNWQSVINCTYCAQPLVSPMVTTTYTVQRTECTTVKTDTVKIIVDDCDPTFVLPNVFTPNGDDVNDTWGINFSTVNPHIKNFKMSIYNRWGLLVYSTNSELSTPNTRWDGHTTSGEECSEGVYYYIVTFEKNEEHVLLKGHLSLFK